MIDYYRSLAGKADSATPTKTEAKINKCVEYYEAKDMSFDELYEEYDMVYDKKVKLEFPDPPDKSLFKKVGGELKLAPIRSQYVKDCVLEALSRVVEFKEESELYDPSSELTAEINRYKKNFKYYPDLSEHNMASQLYFKEELRRHSIPDKLMSFQDKCDTDFFELAPHQLFLKNFFSPNTPYQSLLLFHGVGVGKSCSGISIAENFKTSYSTVDKRSIILSSQNIRAGWRKTIFDPSKDDDQCTGDTYSLDEESDTKVVRDPEKKAKKKIKQFYELHGYMAFAGTVKKHIKEGLIGITDEKARHLKTIELIREKYSGRVLIIDEVHNVRGEATDKDSNVKATKKEVRKTIKYIEMVIKYSEKLKLILLTANPMFNNAQEIVWVLNMLLMNDNRKTVSSKEIFDSGELTARGAEILARKFQGYVSYLRGENPVSFPIRIYPKNNGKPLIQGYKMDASGGDTIEPPKIDLFDREISESERLSFTQLYPSVMIDTGLQGQMYTEVVQRIKDEAAARGGESLVQIHDETKMLQMVNIVYPGASDTDNCYGETGLANCFHIDTRANTYKYKQEILDEYGPFLLASEISPFSCKIKSILDAIKISDGIVFIYSNWISGGIVPLILALEQNGYKRYEGKSMLSLSDERVKESVPREGQGNFMVIAGSAGFTNNFEREMQTVTHPGNKDGSKIKIIIGSTVASEGLDFKCVRSIHVLEPWHNVNKLEQVIGRGIRNCSHKFFDESEKEKRNITIYLHSAMTSDPEKETIDTYLYRYAEKKSRQIGEIEMILKRCAVDRYFFKSVNYLSPAAVEKIMIDPASHEHEAYSYSPHDRPFTRVTSFTDDADYMKDDIPDLTEVSDDTFQLEYSKALIEVYKKRIFNLFKVEEAFSLAHLKERLEEQDKLYDDFFYTALQEMILEKYPLYNRNADRGYMIHLNDMFVFQPYFNQDEFIPLYYRLNRGLVRENEFLITSQAKRLATVDTEERSFPDDQIIELMQSIMNYEFTKPVPDKLSEEDILEFMNLREPNLVWISFVLDRLLFDEKISLLYCVLSYLHGDITISDEETLNNIGLYLVPFFEPLFLYYDNDTYSYRAKYEKKYKKQLVGGFLYHHINKQPVFFRYNKADSTQKSSIEVFNRKQEISISMMLKKIKDDPVFQMKRHWAFTMYSTLRVSREAHNGIVLKVVKSTDQPKKAFPPGSGVICLSESRSWQGESTVNFIENELKEFYDSLTPENQDKLTKTGTTKNQKNKQGRIFFVELCFRQMKESFLQSDLVFAKYY